MVMQKKMIVMFVMEITVHVQIVQASQMVMLF